MDREQFYREIYDIVRAIPPGRVATYGQIASLAGRPLCSRMVGQALHRAPASSRLPCHRVVNSQGRTVPACISIVMMEVFPGPVKIYGQMYIRNG